ncbi:MAG: hypothetical protein ACREAX_00575 [Candidatus Nitrosotenuis sp.]
MVFDPPKQPVDVRRMMIYSVIPFLDIYAGWRVQKFWVIFGIVFLVGLVMGALFGVVSKTNELPSFTFYLYYILSIGVGILVSLLLVMHYARKYNKKISQQPSS